jgi:hypothetical protein
MAERRFQILKYIQKAPSTATCEACHLKFFVPMDLLNDPAGAEEHLRRKYADHKCRPILFAQFPYLKKK